MKSDPEYKLPYHDVTEILLKLVLNTNQSINQNTILILIVNSKWNDFPQYLIDIHIRYSTIETKEAACIGYNGFLFSNKY